VYFVLDGRTVEADDYEYLTIEPQGQLGRHRVDFLLTLYSVEPFDIGPPPTDQAKVTPRGHAFLRLVVECDGHDFHDRTKEQSSRDRARDRALTGFGLQVFRFTGADICKDVMGCARE